MIMDQLSSCIMHDIAKHHSTIFSSRHHEYKVVHMSSYYLIELFHCECLIWASCRMKVIIMFSPTYDYLHELIGYHRYNRQCAHVEFYILHVHIIITI